MKKECLYYTTYDRRSAIFVVLYCNVQVNCGIVKLTATFKNFLDLFSFYLSRIFCLILISMNNKEKMTAGGYCGWFGVLFPSSLNSFLVVNAHFRTQHCNLLHINCVQVAQFQDP